MLRDLAAWLLYSPRRLVAVVVPVVALAGIGSVGLNDPGHERSQAHATAQDSPHHSAAGLSVKQATDSEKPAPLGLIRQAARRFLDEYVIMAGAGTPKAVPSSLRRLTTPALWEGLRLTQPDVLPRGSVDQVNVESAGPFSGTVTAKLDSGNALSVSVVAWQKGWRVSDVRPADTP